MKIWILFFCLMMYLLPVHASEGDYVLGAGDILLINVFGIAEMNVPEMPVRPDGKITVPSIGEIKVSGLTAEELSIKLAEKLSFYYENPKVTVTVNQFRTTRIYVVGQVTRPGFYELDKSHTLLDAIGAAQGWTQDALKTKVYIVRKGSTGEPLKVNLLDIVKKGDSSKNYNLNEGDIVYLDDNHRIDVVRDIVPLVNPLWLVRNWRGTTAPTTTNTNTTTTTPTP